MQLTEHTYFGENNRYYLEKLLGRGGFSEVWLVKDSFDGLELALKVYAPSTGMDDDGLHIFTKELNVVQNIHHPNLLTSSYVGSWQNMPYLIMPYCPQGSLVKKIGQVTEDEAWQILKDVATGLDCLHSQPSPIIHQDIKPDNILVNASGHYVITDFGISARAQSTLLRTVRNAANGTSAYMGPERFGTDPLPIKASDVWALGATLFELIEGYTPFGNLGGLSQKSGADIPIMKASVSDKLKQAIYSMLQKETWDRPTAKTLVELSQNTTGIGANGNTNTTRESERTGRWVPILSLILQLPILVFAFVFPEYSCWGLFISTLIPVIAFLYISIRPTSRDIGFTNYCVAIFGVISLIFLSVVIGDDYIFYFSHLFIICSIIVWFCCRKFLAVSVNDCNHKLSFWKYILICVFVILCFKGCYYYSSKSIYGWTHQEIGKCYDAESRGDYAKAKEHYQKVANKGLYWGFHGLADCSVNEGKYDEAKDYIDYAISQYENFGKSKYDWDISIDEMYAEKGKILLLQGEYEEAMSIYERLKLPEGLTASQLCEYDWDVKVFLSEMEKYIEWKQCHSSEEPMPSFYQTDMGEVCE